MKRVFIIHGWGGNSEEGWFPWLKKELKEKGFQVEVPDMPHSEIPKISSWGSHLNKIIGKADNNTFLVGHSIGCQAIMRYLEQLSQKERIGGAVLVAGFFTLTGLTAKEKPIAKPWLENLIDFKKVKEHCSNLTVILSDNDSYVPLEENKLKFEKELNAKVIVKPNMGHFSGENGITELPSALQEILKFSKEVKP